LKFVEETQFERLGVFKYSEEDGTAAARMDGKVSDEEKERRWQEVMDLQSTISQKKNQALIGSIQRVMIEELDSEAGKLVGRTQAHAPEIDGFVYLEGLAGNTRAMPTRPGDLVSCRITGALEYDLMGEIIHA
jgi:ribosomal protein S12 methylthiotransferase